MRNFRHPPAAARGFTLVEVLVALMVVVIGLAALLITVSSTARTSAFLRDKTVAQWIALNRITEVRLNINKFGSSGDTAEIDFANRKWHYDTRYFDTDIKTMRRVVVRVYAGDSKTKGNPLAETVGFTANGTLSAPGSSATVNWQQDALTPDLTNPTGTPVTGTGASTTGTPPSQNPQLTNPNNQPPPPTVNP
jgi:general secretion pathway protein I